MHLAKVTIYLFDIEHLLILGSVTFVERECFFALSSKEGF